MRSSDSSFLGASLDHRHIRTAAPETAAPEKTATMELPMDAIKAVQIAFRREANMSSYDPDNTPMPNLPSVEETIAELDPSPPQLRCKSCKGRLQRGVQSLICVFCGAEPRKDLPPDPINFRDTVGYRWFLKSLNLTGSEIVDLPTGAKGSIRGQTARKDELSLSDLLNIEIKYTPRPEKTEASLSDEKPPQPKSVPDLSGVSFDNFFSKGKKDAASSTSEEVFDPSTRMGSEEESNAFQVRETLSLFENVQPSQAVVQSSEGESGDSFSGWAADFQSGPSETLAQPSETPPHASENFPRESKSFDPFVGSTVDLSAHMDTAVGSVVDSREKSDRSTDWFQADLLDVSNSGLAVGSDQFETLAEVKGGIAENANNSFSAGFDWAQDNQFQTTSSKAPEIKNTDGNDDSLDAWNDFTGPNSAANLVDSSLKQSINEKAPVDQTSDNKNTYENDDSFDAWNDFTGSNSAENLVDSSFTQSVNGKAPVDQTSEINLFGPSSNSGDLDFGIFSQPDVSAGVHDSTVADPSVLDRLADGVTKGENNSGDVSQGGGVPSVRAGSKSEDAERIMAQMHDLSFMLESKLSIPPKRDGLPSHSQD